MRLGDDRSPGRNITESGSDRCCGRKNAIVHPVAFFLGKKAIVLIYLSMLAEKRSDQSCQPKEAIVPGVENVLVEIEQRLVRMRTIGVS